TRMLLRSAPSAKILILRSPTLGTLMSHRPVHVPSGLKPQSAMIVKRAGLRCMSTDNYHAAYAMHPPGKIAFVPKRQEGAQTRRPDGSGACTGRRNPSRIGCPQGLRRQGLLREGLLRQGARCAMRPVVSQPRSGPAARVSPLGMQLERARFAFVAEPRAPW